MENTLSNFVQFFYEKHPYLSAQQVKFKEDSGQVCAIVKGLGVTCAVESNGRVIGFDVLDMGEQGKLLLTKQNFDNIMASSSNFARPSKQKKINPRMESQFQGRDVVDKSGYVRCRSREERKFL